MAPCCLQNRGITDLTAPRALTISPLVSGFAVAPAHGAPSLCPGPAQPDLSGWCSRNAGGGLASALPPPPPLPPKLTCPPGSRLSRKPWQSAVHAIGSSATGTAHGGGTGIPAPLDYPPTGLEQRPRDSPPPTAPTHTGPTHTLGTHRWDIMPRIHSSRKHGQAGLRAGVCTHHTQGHTHSLPPPRAVSRGGPGMTEAGTLQRGVHQ